MKVAIMADIHSNLPALEAVIREIERVHAEMTVCAGDIVGYGANPNECAHRVEEIASFAVMGNHEASALANDPAGMNPYAAAAARWTAEHLDDRTRGYLQGLGVGARFDIAGRSATMYHGTVDDYLEYVYEQDVEQALLERADAEVLILGHTHIPYVKRFAKGIVVNPGSVGQPRDGDPRASLAVYDSDGSDCSVRRLDYDIGSAADAISRSGLPAMLADRLYLGR